MNTIDEKQFKELINDTIVVQFSASWCGPCKTLTKFIDDNEDAFGRQIYKMDIDNCRALCNVLAISSVPTLIRFENKEETKRVIGMCTIEQLRELTL